MAPATSRLAIDLSGGVVRLLEGIMGGPMRSGSAALPDGSMIAGKVTNPAAVGHTLKQLMARTDVTESRALLAVSDSAATFRVLNLPAGTTDEDVAAAVSKELPLDPERIATRWMDVEALPVRRVVYAVAWDRAHLKSLTDSVRAAGLDPTAVELRSASLARAVTQRTCIVVDLVSESIEMVLVDQHVPRLWHGLELKVPWNDDFGLALATPLRSMLRFYRRPEDSDFDPTSPVLISAEQAVPAQVLTQLAALVNQPVQLLPAPPRVPANVRHSTYLACLGLIMRRN